MLSDMSDQSAASPSKQGDSLELSSPNLTDAQRNGSITGIGIVLGFSLTFTGQWSLGAGAWRWYSAAALGVAVCGIVMQLRALFTMFELPSVTTEVHGRAVRGFKLGVVLMLVAFGLHVFLDFLADHGVPLP
jgi:hypothetical protein